MRPWWFVVRSRAIAELRSQADDHRLLYATWHEVGGWAFEAGQQAAGGSLQWLDASTQPTNHADQRLLAELIWDLEEEGYAMTRPLTDRQIKQAGELFRLEDTLGELIRDMRDRVNDADLGLRLVQGSVAMSPQ
jgi:hypothetical protein